MQLLMVPWYFASVVPNVQSTRVLLQRPAPYPKPPSPSRRSYTVDFRSLSSQANCYKQTFVRMMLHFMQVYDEVATVVAQEQVGIW